MIGKLEGASMRGEGAVEAIPYILKKRALMDSIALIYEENFNSAVSNDQRLKILSLIARGVSRVSQMAEELGIVRTALYRHLHFLEDRGWIVKQEENFLLTSSIYLVYRIRRIGYSVAIEVLEDKGAFVDTTYGFLVIMNGVDANNRCANCLLVDICRNGIDPIARRLEVSMAEMPAVKIISALSRAVKNNIEHMMRKGFVVIRR